MAHAKIIKRMPHEERVALWADLSGDEIAMLLRGLPNALSTRLLKLTRISDNDKLRTSLAFDDDTIGAAMDFQPVLVNEHDSIAILLTRLRAMEDLPSHCDKLFVTDNKEHWVGVLPLKRLLFNTADVMVCDIMVTRDIRTFASR